MMLKRLVKTAASLVVLTVTSAFAPSAMADTPSPLLDQSQANRLSIFHDYSIDATGSTQSGLAVQGDGGLLTPWLEQYGFARSVVPQKNWFVSATPVLGYDSNPEARELAKSSAFIGVDLHATYATELATENATPVFFSAGMAGALYEGMVKQANVFQPYASAGIRHSFLDDTVIVSGELKDQLTLENGDAFLNSLDVAPSVEAFWFPELSTEVAYDFAHMEYFFPVPKIQDPDTERSTLNFNLHLYPLPQGKNGVVSESEDQLTDILRQTLHSVVIGFGHVWNKADGIAYQYESNRIIFGLEGIRPLKSSNLVLNLQYAHEWQNYKEDVSPTSDVITPGQKIRRDDHLDTLTFRADARLADLPRSRGTLGGFVQWDWIRDFSFIQARDFNEFVISAGVTYRY